ncbi:MAG: hypothetical protein KME19_24000 [Microcoleus vaginatus WJT46-NPBG5]|nr:hypothetical protein [Microcoleus vaginatus WJT46-NPBG5]
MLCLNSKTQSTNAHLIRYFMGAESIIPQNWELGMGHGAWGKASPT